MVAYLTWCIRYNGGHGIWHLVFSTILCSMLKGPPRTSTSLYQLCHWMVPLATKITLTWEVYPTGLFGNHEHKCSSGCHPKRSLSWIMMLHWLDGTVATVSNIAPPPLSSDQDQPTSRSLPVGQCQWEFVAAPASEVSSVIQCVGREGLQVSNCHPPRKPGL